MNIGNRPPLGLKAPKERYTPQEARYYAWLHDQGQCCLTGRADIELAHTGGLTEGKGTGRKAWLKTVLPIAKPLHVLEERNRRQFWVQAGHPDYLAWAERLFDIYEANYSPLALFLDMQEQADRAFLTTVLRAA